MAAAEISATIVGGRELDQLLKSIPRKHAKKAIKKASKNTSKTSK